MDTKTKCEEVLKKQGWTQKELADELGITPQNMTHVLKGRRGLPTPAFIRLEKLRGIKAERILDELLRTAACIALAVVVLLTTAVQNPAMASKTYNAEYQPIHIMVVLAESPLRPYR